MKRELTDCFKVQTPLQVIGMLCMSVVDSASESFN